MMLVYAVNQGILLHEFNHPLTERHLSNTAFKDLSPEELDDLIDRVTEAQEHELALSFDDCQLLIDALLTLATLHEKLSDSEITIAKLRKLAGIIRSSEKLSRQLGRGETKKSRSGRNKKNTPDLRPEVVKHPLTEQSKGDECPECGKGTLHKYEPATLLRIKGHSPFTPEQHIMERLRCNACGAYFTADLPEEVKADGGANQKYGYSACSIMAVAKFFSGTPYYRQGSLQDMLGVSIAASTIFDQSEKVANAVFPVFRYLLNILAPDAWHYYIDDTSNRILNQKPIKKKRRNSDEEQIRTGIYTSGVIATLADGHKLVLYETGISHAGELIDEILKQRSPGAKKPMIMSDALSSNRPTVCEATITLCNAHARRQFYDLLNHFEEKARYVLERYNKIWQHDDHTVENNMSAKERLAYHQTHSQPIMEELLEWCNEQLESEKTEENSGLGKAIKYFIKHYNGLTCFCKIEGAAIDNNLMETRLKLVVRNRKNAGFFKTGSGAAIGDVITSMIATSQQVGVNAVNYFTYIQRHAEQVKAAPQNYLPWQFKEKR